MKETVLISGLCTWGENSCSLQIWVREMLKLNVFRLQSSKVKGFRVWNSASRWKSNRWYEFVLKFGFFFFSVPGFALFGVLRLLTGIHCKISGEWCWTASGTPFEMGTRDGNESWPTVCMALQYLTILFRPVLERSGAIAERPTSQPPEAGTALGVESRGPASSS